MYKRKQKENDPTAHAGDRWDGPARITGFEDKGVVWLSDSGLPVCGATHLIRPANASEMLAAIVMARNFTPFVAEELTRTEGEQQRYVDLRVPSSVVVPSTENKGGNYSTCVRKCWCGLAHAAGYGTI